MIQETRATEHRGCPRTVDIAVGWQIFVALLALAAGLFLVVSGATSEGKGSATNLTGTSTRLLGLLFIGLALAMVLLAIGLSRGSQKARLGTTILQIALLAADASSVLWARFDLVGLLGHLTGVAVFLWLIWNPKAGSYFLGLPDSPPAG